MSEGRMRHDPRPRHRRPAGGRTLPRDRALYLSFPKNLKTGYLHQQIAAPMGRVGDGAAACGRHLRRSQAIPVSVNSDLSFFGMKGAI